MSEEHAGKRRVERRGDRRRRASAEHDPGLRTIKLEQPRQGAGQHPAQMDRRAFPANRGAAADRHRTDQRRQHPVRQGHPTAMDRAGLDHLGDPVRPLIAQRELYQQPDRQPADGWRQHHPPRRQRRHHGSDVFRCKSEKPQLNQVNQLPKQHPAEPGDRPHRQRQHR